MTFTGISFFIFLPITILLYFLIPGRYRYIWLLFVSYFFYSSVSSSFTSLLIISTLITWICGNSIYKCETDTGKKIIIALGTAANLSILCVFKYAGFIASLFNSSNNINLILPAGISFYTFQSLTYIYDCYRKEVEPEKNVFKYALFVSFFPLILSGPIERAKNILPQLDFSNKFDTVAAKNGLKLMLYGYFLKMVIVARLDILTNLVFSDYKNQTGFAILCGIIAYTIQIYCDFAGYSNIAIGICEIIGIKIMRNFRQPYFATSIADFWRRWHISLSTWFRDYLYIPLGGNRKGNLRKNINVMIVFLLSGIWHGANTTFVIWGFLNGIYQIIGSVLKPFRKAAANKIQLEKYPSFSKYVSIIFTFILISLTWVFFRADSVNDAFLILGRLFTSFSPVNIIDGTVFSLGLGRLNLLFVLFAILIMAAADVLCEKNSCDVSGLLVNTPAVLRWAIYYGLIVMIIFSCNLSTREFIYQAF